MRALLALGGNAMTGPDGSATVEAQERAIATAVEAVADLVAAGVEVVLTHGNGPQVGNLLVKNDSGSMGPKVEAVVRFVEQGGRRVVITSLDRIGAAVTGGAGKVVEQG